MARPRRTTDKLFDDDAQDAAATATTPEAPDAAAPLAERMRPRTFDEFVGQRQLVGEGRFLRRIIEGEGMLPSLI
ncbi:MAG TPA: hypothetical protein VF064_19265, partial [Pyrinomonadaceae bacterium]